MIPYVCLRRNNTMYVQLVTTEKNSLVGNPPPKNMLKRSSGVISAWKSAWAWLCLPAVPLTSPYWSYWRLFSGLDSTAYAFPMAAHNNALNIEPQQAYTQAIWKCLWSEVNCEDRFDHFPAYKNVLTELGSKKYTEYNQGVMSIMSNVKKRGHLCLMQRTVM